MAFIEADSQRLEQRIRDARQAIAAREGAADLTAFEAEDMRRAVEILNRLEIKQN
jgi:hypothetical protein